MFASDDADNRTVPWPEAPVQLGKGSTMGVGFVVASGPELEKVGARGECRKKGPDNVGPYAFSGINRGRSILGELLYVVKDSAGWQEARRVLGSQVGEDL